MATILDKISSENFSLEDIDVSAIEEIDSWLPTNEVMDVNIAEQGLVKTLSAQNACQEYISRVDRIISIMDGKRDVAWAEAALTGAPSAGHKTAKDKEWFAQADPDYIEACNEVALAKAAKKWLENKADHFKGWHYAFKTFLKRDYDLERLGNFQQGGYNSEPSSGSRKRSSDFEVNNESEEVKWSE